MSDGVLGLIGVVISVFGTYCIAVYNKHNTKKQNKENEETQRMVLTSQKDFEVQMLAREQEFQEKLTQKQIDANLKAKARIEWITQVRVQSADFITNCLLYLEYSPKRIVGKPTNVRVENIESNTVTITADVEPDEEVLSRVDDVVDAKEKEKIRVQLNNAANLLMIYFGPDKDGENEKIVEFINEILKKVNSGIFYKDDTRSSDLIIEFRDEIRNYLKQEWNVAKEGK
ncbi:hypothetical protein [Enterococcus mundtii]|uniref:hypothetical protein n=1 Tax=Enterococcus mundtii TaxID=53346 RepID=UPI000BB55E5B|nr:hypothetical protein [Enterococcus mundtii]PJK24557.1 hypothetical protein CV769_14855 [Enterococcus mundtii]